MINKAVELLVFYIAGDTGRSIALHPEDRP